LIIFFLLSPTALPEGQEAMPALEDNTPVVKNPRESLPFWPELERSLSAYCRMFRKS
jgi:hypothetical protein